MAILLWWEILIFVFALGWFFFAVLTEKDLIAGIIVIATAAISNWFLEINIRQWLEINWQSLLLFLPTYFLCGCTWSVFKWYRFVKSKYQEYISDKVAFFKTRKVGGQLTESDLKGLVIPEEHKQAWKDHVRFRDYPPEPKEHKGKIIRWIVVWPVFVLSALFSDFLFWIGRKVMERIEYVYLAINNRVFRDMRYDK